MIISASRRTDIPAFYTPWFIHRIRAGWCSVPNPFNPLQVAEVSLRPEDVDVIVFWTRYPLPMMPHFKEMEDRGYRFYFLYTLMANPREIDPNSPSLTNALTAFNRLADRIGPERVIWRYDPILLSSVTDADFHKRTFRYICGKLEGYTRRCITSAVNPYRKAKKRFIARGVELRSCDGEEFGNLVQFMAEETHGRGMELFSCAQTLDWDHRGVKHGKCVDDEYIEHAFGVKVSRKKDPSQRKACRCVVSKDIGMYDTCLFGCLYCYATGSFEKAKENYRSHDPTAPSLVASARSLSAGAEQNRG
jgi:hypothetical protein